MKRINVSPFFILLIVYGIIAIFLTRVPLLNVLGYEFSAFMGIVSAIGGGFFTFSLFRKRFSPAEPILPAEYTGFLFSAAIRNELALALPVAIMTFNGFAVKNCSISRGAAFVLLIPAVTILFCVALAGLVSLVVRRRRLVYSILLFFILVSPLLHAYFEPQLYSYNALYGFFPGFSYDELLPLTWTLVMYRGLILCATVVLVLGGIAVAGAAAPKDGWTERLAAFVSMGRRKKLILSVIPLLAVLALSFWFRYDLSLETSSAYIQKILGAHYSTRHFEIYYSRSSYSDEEIRRVAGMHEFRYMQLLSDLRSAPRAKIHSYIYPSYGVKQRLLGTSTTDIARPWMREIHINPESIERTLKHELVHVMAAPFGFPFFGVSPRMGLIEGLAVAFGDENGERTLHQYAEGMREFGIDLHLANLLSYTGFVSQAPAKGYIACGSFVRYLVDTYGIQRFKRTYASGSFESGYGRSLRSLIDEWNEFLLNVPVANSDETHIRFRFRRPPIFSAVCPRVAAAWLTDAWSFFGQKKYSEAAALFRHAYGETGNPDAAGGYLQSEFRLKEFDSVIAAAPSGDALIVQPYSGLLAGDAFLMKGDTANARNRYRAIYEDHILRAFDELAAMRLIWLDQPRQDSLMRRYYFAETDSERIGMLRDAVRGVKLNSTTESFYRYLLMRLLIYTRHYADGRSAIDAKGSDLGNPFLNYSSEMVRARFYTHEAQWEKSKLHYWRALNFTKQQAEMDEITDRIEMCEWFERHNAF